MDHFKNLLMKEINHAELDMDLAITDENLNDNAIAASLSTLRYILQSYEDYNMSKYLIDKSTFETIYSALKPDSDDNRKKIALNIMTNIKKEKENDN